MLTRLRVKGFKSLEDIEVRFGPFTCIAGVNGVGKSNLFDAIVFLKYLADLPIIEAATNIRNNTARQRTNISSLFTKTSNHHAQLMEFEADFLVPDTVVDDFGRSAKPKVTYLRYKLSLKYIPATASTSEGIELAAESLTFIQKGLATRELGFEMSKDFFTSIYLGGSKIDFIYMDESEVGVAKIRQDQTGGPPISIPISKAGRTILSNINTIDRPTALAARREMQSWINLQLESSSLRKPDDFLSVSSVSPTGEHLPAALDRLKKNEEVANQLATLLPEVSDVFVDVDEKRQLKTLYLETTSGIRHEARSLSDGTLRFLALAIIGADPEAGGVICLEEPENGIHPARIPAIVELLSQMAVDPRYPVGPDNPLRQIIINTHSPLVIEQLQLDNLIVSQAYKFDGASLSTFSPIQHTWRDASAEATSTGKPVGLGSLMAYLSQDDVPEQDIAEKRNLRQAYKHQLSLLTASK
nr:AAA family ATPase [uncultured Duganella sp.]